MHGEPLRDAIVSLIVDIIEQARARLDDPLENRVRSLERKERILDEAALQGETPKMPPNKSQYWTINRAAEHLSMTPGAIRAMIRRDQFPRGIVLRFGRRIRFDSGKLEKWLANHAMTS